MHLGDGRRRNRWIEACVKLRNRPAERSFDSGAGLGFREGCHAVLQACQIVGDLGANDIGPCGEELAELDPGGAEPLDRAGQPVGALGALGLTLGQQAGNPVAKLQRSRQVVGGQRGDHAFAHKDEARPHQTQIGAETCHAAQIFQAE